MSRHTPSAATLGLTRRLTRICDADGFILGAAIDHPETYQVLFDKDTSKVGYDEVVQSKLELIEAMAPHASMMLLDPVWSAAQSVATGALPGTCGLVSGIEALYWSPETSGVGFATRNELRATWTPAKLNALGVDAAKLVIFLRADDEAAVQDEAHRIVEEAAAQCRALQMPLIVEPIWYPRAGESLSDEEVAANHDASVLTTARTLRQAGADLMKVEFPLVGDLEGRETQADEACHALNEAIDGVWVLLSAGVTFDGFREQMRHAAARGASGFMAGRAVWGDSVGRFSDEERARGAALAVERLQVLGEIVRRTGTPAWAPTPAASVGELVPQDWHETFGA